MAEQSTNPMDMTIEEKMRSSHVKRWHIVRTLREQSVAEHSFVVMLLSMEILKRAGEDPDYLGPIHGEMGYLVLRYAMWHDLIEVRMGDIITPMKTRLRAELGDGVLERIEGEFSAEWSTLMAQTPAGLRLVVKLADMLEATCFITNEGHGKHAAEVADYMRECLRAKLSDMPHMDYIKYGRHAEAIAIELGLDLGVTR